jgi:MFS family permease
MVKPKIFYGYWVLGACSLIGMISNGTIMNSFSLLVRPLQAELGWNRTQIMAGFSVLICVTGLAAPFTGRLLDRFGARKVIVPGVLITVMGLSLLSGMRSLWHFYLGYGLMGIGFTTSGPVGVSYVVSHWFRRRRGFAVGLLSTGMALNGMVFIPLIAAYLIPSLGWSNTYLVLAFISGGVIIPLSLFVVRTKPADLGLSPDGLDDTGIPTRDQDTSPGGQETGRTHPVLSLKMALATPAFWFMGVSLVLNHTHLGVIQSVFPHLRDLGYPVSTAASVLVLSSAMFCVSMFFFGWLCDRVLPKFAAAIGLGLIVVGIVFLLAVGPSSPVCLVWLYALIMGLGVGSWMPTMSMLASNTFGMAAYGAIFGALSFFQNLGGSIGPLIAGYSFDLSHSYRSGFMTILAMVLVAIPLVLAVPRRVNLPGR